MKSKLIKDTYIQPYHSIISSVLVAKDSKVIEEEESHTDHERGSDDEDNHQARVTTPRHLDHRLPAIFNNSEEMFNFISSFGFSTLLSPQPNTKNHRGITYK